MNDTPVIAATIRSIRLAREDVAVLTLDAPGFLWVAGQYLRLGADGFVPRFYSIANAPLDSPYPEIHVRRSGMGGLTDHLVDAASVGDALGINGPFGDAVLPDDDARPVLLIAAGVGIAPMRAVMQHALAFPHTPVVMLAWGTNYPSDQYLALEFETLAKANDRFHFLSVTGVPVSVATGSFIREYKNARIFLSGPPAMVRDTRALLEASRIAPGMIHHDPIPPAKNTS